ncbi:Ricin-type beta-trefoil lectin domain-containing protein [Lentzea albidocapillata subsp. violacea]|uniref:Ricin-type beta-trefoil lectin domain-containing protein n=2 Tax=Lentzea albidocapillata TaxID=40571 RepID=A0A1G9MRX7_9PSEU|nr:Ricin-type beta-trefoil lectin domain-containing protein [Lentzea albidocapillata subsp. violacea]
MKMLSVALAAIALGAVTVAPASAAPEGNKIVEIKSAADGLCLDFTRSDTSRAGMSACTGGAAQQFERIPTATGGSYLRNIADGHCVDGYSSDVLDTQCQHGVPGQRFQEVADADGTVRLSAPTRSGTRFIDSVLFAGDGTVIMADDSARSTQRWLVREVGVVPPPQLGAVTKLRSAYEGTCVTDGVNYFNELKPCATASGFERIDVGGGKVALRSQASGKCLAVAAPSDSVQLADCDTTAPDQQWTLTGDELGNYTIANADRHLLPFGDRVIVYPYAAIGLLQHWQLPAA